MPLQHIGNKEVIDRSSPLLADMYFWVLEGLAKGDNITAGDLGMILGIYADVFGC